MARGEESWRPTKGWLVVQGGVAAAMVTFAGAASVVQGLVVVPVSATLGAALLCRDIGRRRAWSPPVGPARIWSVAGQRPC